MYKIRPLQLTDKVDILEIAQHTWDGYDYLPYFFESWLKDTDSHTAAIEVDEHVVALANLRIIDNGQTGWMEGLRVHPDYRGTGMATVLTKHIVEMAEKIPVARIRYTTAAGNEPSLHLAEKVGMKRKITYANHWQDQLDKISLSPSGQLGEPISPMMYYEELHQSKIIPHGIIVYDWKAIDITLENLQKISHLANFWIERENNEIQSFSLGFVKEVKSGPEWSSTIYTSNKTNFLNQVSNHLTYALSNKCNSLFLIYPLEFQETLYELDWIRIWEDEVMEMVLLERIF